MTNNQTTTPTEDSDLISFEEVRALFGDELPITAFKLLFPEKSDRLDVTELLTVLRALSGARAGFLHRLIENAFSWALQDCNYLNPKYMDRLIADTLSGMKPAQAAEWNATAPEASRRLERAGKDSD